MPNEIVHVLCWSAISLEGRQSRKPKIISSLIAIKTKLDTSKSAMRSQTQQENRQTRAGVYETLCPQHMLASKDNLETRCPSQKRGIIQSNIYRNLPKINQVIFTIDTICVPNIMILAQMFLQIFCWQGSIGLQWMSEKGDNSAKYLQNFAKC